MRVSFGLYATMPSALACVKDAARRFAVPPPVGILDARFAAGGLLLAAEGGYPQ